MKEEDALELLFKYGCSQDVIEHCRAVAKHARKIAAHIKNSAGKRGEQIDIDMDAVFLGALLHDIGRSRTHGIKHALEGAKIARENALSDKLVKIIERHIGAGIPEQEAAFLGLPEKDYMPVTLEEKIVAHADNLVSDSKVVGIDELTLCLRKKHLDEKIIQRIVRLNDEINAMMR